VPNGEIVRNKERVDPMPCIQDRTASGSITVRDIGSLADDAFEVYLDGIHIGTTAIGAANSFAINNLIPGAHSLRIVGVIVPDDIGTYEVILSDGITFQDGSVRRSGVVSSQGSVTFTIIVPAAATQTVSPTLLMQGNPFSETSLEE
jgi:hypothetical protein